MFFVIFIKILNGSRVQTCATSAQIYVLPRRRFENDYFMIPLTTQIYTLMAIDFTYG